MVLYSSILSTLENNKLHLSGKYIYIYKFIKDIYLKISSKTWNYLKRKKEGSIKEDKGKKKGRWLI